MKSEYHLRPSNFLYRLEDHFPIPLHQRKIGVFLSGGMESSLISYIAIQIYGKDNVVFFYSDSIFSSNNPTVNHYIKTNINKVSILLNIQPTYVEFDYNLHIDDRVQSIKNKIEFLKDKYATDFFLFGFTKLFFDVEVFKRPGTTLEKIKEIVFSDRSKFHSVIEEFHIESNTYTDHLLDIDIPYEVYPILKSRDGSICSPFKDLNKSEVVDLYRQLDILDILYKTSSCIRETITLTGKHCGNCFNCQQRWDAFSILGGVNDLTEYASDNVKIRRQQLFSHDQKLK